MSAAQSLSPPTPPRRTSVVARGAWDQLSIYLPIILMAVMALGTYWLARNTPVFSAPEPAPPARHEPDYYMRGFSVKTFDATGHLKSEVFGTEARHYPDTDTLEIDRVRIRSYNEKDELTVAAALRALSNADGSEVQLIGDAVVSRAPTLSPSGVLTPLLEIRGEFLHAFLNTERVTSNKPVTLVRGKDRFDADRLDFDNVSRVMDLTGHVHGVLVPGSKALSAAVLHPAMPRLVFITGASSGIGQALAQGYYDAGWSLALVARRAGEIERWAREHALDRQRYAVYAADVSVTDSIVAAGVACMAGQGLPDVVIANAGFSSGVDSAIREDIDVLARTFATNTVGVAATFHPFIAAMRARGSGHLVGIASVAGMRGLPGHAAYCASKAAVISYCESLRGEMRGSGVRVVTLSPGYVDTPLTRRNRYGMPFLLTPAQFAQRAVAAIEAGVRHRVIPWQMGVVAFVLRALPDWLFDRLLVGRPRKHREPSN